MESKAKPERCPFCADGGMVNLIHPHRSNECYCECALCDARGPCSADGLERWNEIVARYSKMKKTLRSIADWNTVPSITYRDTIQKQCEEALR